LLWRRRADSNRRTKFCPVESLAMTWIKPLSHVSSCERGILGLQRAWSSTCRERVADH